MFHSIRGHRSLVVALLASVALCGSVRGDDEPGPIEVAEVTLDRPVDFRKDILPILQAKCLACHSASVAEGSLVLETAESIRKGGDSGAAVVAGKPDESLLSLSAGRRGDPSAMPPLPNEANARPLTPQELGLLSLWIREGAKDSTQAERMITWQSLPGAIDAVYSLALDPSEQLVAAGQGNQIHLYDLVRQRELAILKDPVLSGDASAGSIAHRDVVSSLAFSPDGNWLASGGYRIVKLWQRSEPLEQRRDVGAPALTLAVSPDGQRLAAGLADGRIVIQDRGSDAEEIVISGHEGPVTAVAFRGDGSQLISTSATEIKQWNATSGEANGQLITPSPLRALRMLADGAQLATGHEDGVVRVWSAGQLTPAAEAPADTPAKPEKELSGHTRPVTSLAWLPAEGPRLVSASEEGTIRLWDLEQAKEVGQIAHGSPVSVVVTTADGGRLASAGPDGIARVWDPKGTKIAEVSGDPRLTRELTHRQQDLKVAQSRKTLADKAVTDAEKDVKEREESLKKAQEQVTAAEKTVGEAQPKVDAAQKTVDEATAGLDEMPEDETRKKSKTDAEAALAKEQDALKKASDALASAKRGVELSEKSVATIKANLAVLKQRQETEVAGEAAATAAVKSAEEQTKASAAAVGGLAFATDGSWLAVADAAGRVVIWHVASQQPLSVFTAPGEPAGLNALTTDSEGRVLTATADGHLDTWSSEPTFSLAGHIGPSDASGVQVNGSPIEDRVLAIDFSPDGTLLATGSGVPSRSGQLQLWDVAQRTLIREMTDAHSDTVFDVAFSRDGTLLASGAADKFAKLFDVATGDQQRSFEGHTGHVLSLAWKADGSVLATGGADNAIKAWTTATGEQQRTISSHTKPVNAIAFVGIEEKLVSAAGDKAVLMHTVSNGRNYRRLSGATDFLHAVAVNSDESRVIAGCEDGVVRVWNGADGKLLMSFPSE